MSRRLLRPAPPSWEGGREEGREGGRETEGEGGGGGRWKGRRERRVYYDVMGGKSRHQMENLHKNVHACVLSCCKFT